MSGYNDSFTPHDDIQCEDYYGEPITEEDYLDFQDDHEVIHIEHDFHQVDGDLIDEDGNVTEKGQDLLAELDAAGAFS